MSRMTDAEMTDRMREARRLLERVLIRVVDVDRREHRQMAKDIRAFLAELDGADAPGVVIRSVAPETLGLKNCGNYPDEACKRAAAEISRWVASRALEGETSLADTILFENIIRTAYASRPPDEVKRDALYICEVVGKAVKGASTAIASDNLIELAQDVVRRSVVERAGKEK